MSTTVDIIIKGVAICYQKANKWHVLFPIDAEGCHSIKFSYKKIDDRKESQAVSLAKSTDGISITSIGRAASKTGQTDNFKNYVLDLTSSKLPFKTHSKIKKKHNSSEKAVLMTIENACFSVRKYLQDFLVPLPDLEEVESGHKVPITENTPVAHSVKATVILDDGAQVSVESDQLPGGNFVTEKNSSYVLTFDNDCEVTEEDRNDMDMFYDIIEDTEKPAKRFRIGGVSARTKAIHKPMVEPPDYRNGKPCLAVQVTDPDGLD